MLTQRNYSEEKVIKSYTISGITRGDMYKMTKVYDRVMAIIGNHVDKDAEKKEYLNDDDLYDIAAILSVLTENNRINLLRSVFDECKENLIKIHSVPPYVADEDE